MYWMQAGVRAVYNYALEYAIHQANVLQLPLLTVFGITDKYPSANERHYAFLLEGLADVAQQLQDRGVGFACLHRSPPQAALHCGNSPHAAMVVTDMGYMPVQRQWRSEVAEHLGCAMVEVESEVVVPVREAFPKEAGGSRAFREAINKVRDRFLVPLPGHAAVEVPWDPVLHELLHQQRHSSEEEGGEGEPVEEFDLLSESVDSVLAALDIDRSVPRVDTFRGGHTEAVLLMDEFLDRKLRHYKDQRYDVNRVPESRMSPYLHFGHISPMEIALQAIRRAGPAHHEALEQYLEQLIVRRELSMNFAWYNSNLQSYDALPRWATETLEKHRHDRRHYSYSREDLERAQTHDEYWNAAQIEMVVTGHLHNYLRIYWAKKIIEWTEDPEEAFQVVCHLNDKYQLDGRDPNSYAAIAWCFGRHDGSFPDRGAFGKVRPMGLGGLKRNFDIYKWQRRVMEKERAVGGLERFVGSKGGSSIAAGDVGGGCSGSGSGV